MNEKNSDENEFLEDDAEIIDVESKEEEEKETEDDEKENETNIREEFIARYLEVHPDMTNVEAEDAWAELHEDISIPPEIPEELKEEAKLIKEACDLIVKRGWMLERLDYENEIPNNTIFAIIDEIQMSAFIKRICSICEIEPGTVLETRILHNFAKMTSSNEYEGEEPGEGEEHIPKERKPDELDFEDFDY